MIVNKKGAENVIASLILFIAVMALATTATILFKNYMDKSSGALNEQQSQSNDIMRTSFNFVMASYNDATQTTTAYLKNTGSTRFDPQDLDVYIDGIRIPRNSANRTIQVAEDTDNTNIGIWDPGEELEIQVFKEFSESRTRTITLAAPNGVSTQEGFSS